MSTPQWQRLRKSVSDDTLDALSILIDLTDVLPGALQIRGQHAQECLRQAHRKLYELPIGQTRTDETDRQLTLDLPPAA